MEVNQVVTVPQVARPPATPPIVVDLTADETWEGPARPFKCGRCGRDYKTQGLLKRHTKNLDCGLTKWRRCSLCGNHYPKRSHLRIHLRKTHQIVDSTLFDDYIIEMEPTYPCNTCHFHGENRASLTAHKKTEHPARKAPDQVRHVFGYARRA